MLTSWRSAVRVSYIPFTRVMHILTYSSLSFQKTAAIFLSSLTSSFFPDTVVSACEVDSCGFDILLESSHELNESSFVVLQEEVRRKKGTASVRSYSMLLKVLKAYAAKEKKRLGPCLEKMENEVVDICEINGYLFPIEGPHETDLSLVGDIALIGYRTKKVSNKWLWHIRGVACSFKKSSKTVAAQKNLWDNSAELILEESEAFVDGVFLPKGVDSIKKLIALLTQESSEWIEEVCSEVLDCSSLEDLVRMLIQKRKAFKELQQRSFYEMLNIRWPINLRLPLGALGQERLVVQYLYTATKQFTSDLIDFCRLIQLPIECTVYASQSLYFSLKREVPSDLPLNHVPTAGPYAYILVNGKHSDGRSILLSIVVVDTNSREPVLSIPALSLERWVGFLTELCSALPPFLTKNKVLFVLSENIDSRPLGELRKELLARGIESETCCCYPKDIAKKIEKARQEKVCYIASLGKREIETETLLLYAGRSKKGYTYTFKELCTFFDKLPRRIYSDAKIDLSLTQEA